MADGTFGGAGGHYDPDQPRGPDGRWIAGDDDTYTPPISDGGSGKLGDDSPFGRSKSILGYAAMELENAASNAYRLPRPDRSLVGRYAALFGTWADAAGLDDATFRDRYVGPETPMAVTRYLRFVAKTFATGQRFGDMHTAGVFLGAAARTANNQQGLAPIQDWFHNPYRLEALAAKAPPPPPLPPTPKESGSLAARVLAAINPFGTANAQTRGASPQLTPEEELRIEEYRELQDEFGNKGLSYQVVTNPGWVPTRRDIDDMRSELNRRLAQRHTSTLSPDELLHPQRSCPVLAIDPRIKILMQTRGWTETDIYRTVRGTPAGRTADLRSPKKTSDGLGRNDSATVYGGPGKYRPGHSGLQGLDCQGTGMP